MKAENIIGRRMLQYLRSRSDLNLHIESCDATSVDAMSVLIDKFRPSFGGCILLSAVLSDRLFMSHTADTFFAPFPPKKEAFQALEKAFAISSLDFLIAVSSAATFGNPGQTAYARFGH